MRIHNRLNWIDWAKAFAISCVVFGHTPQVPGSFPQFYIVTFHMPLFMFISGYLTKKELLNIKILKKYWHTLIIPYLCYNFIIYPYWAIRKYIEVSNVIFFDYIKPIIGVFVLQGESEYYEPLNGVTWFVVSLFAYKLILSVCNRFKYGYVFILVLIPVTSILYVYNQFYLFLKDLTPAGFVGCFPFYFLGYYCNQKQIISPSPQKYSWLIGGTCICLSVVLFFIGKQTNSMLLYGIRYWFVCLFAIFGVLELCKSLDRVHSKIIENISIGTIVIMGIHFIVISITNYVMKKLLCIDGKIIYPWYFASILVLIFEGIIYPIIIVFKNKYPFMLGKKL